MKKVRIIIITLAIFLLLPFAVFGTKPANPGVPKILTYQGRLLDPNGNLLGGSSGTNYCFKFSFYDDETVGSPDEKIWPTDAPSAMTINVKSGVFSAAIGDTEADGDELNYNFQSNDEIYLNVEVATQVGGSCSGASFENLAPRQRIYSTGFAINSLTVGGFTPAQSASSTQIPVLTNGNLVLGGTNPQINVTGTNTLNLGATDTNVAIAGLNCSGYASGGTLTTNASGTIICAGDDTGAGGGITSLNGLTEVSQTFATTTGTNFTISSNGTTHTFQFPSFLAGIISTSTAYTSLGFSSPISYHSATTSQALDLGLGANAYNSTAFLSSLATSTSGSGFTVSGNTIYFPTFLNPVVSTSTLYTAAGFASPISYHSATGSQATDLGLGSNAYRSTTFLSSAITSLNTLTGTTQTFATTTGTNFTISSNGTTHTFQFPSFLAGVISSSTAYTAWGFSNPISYHSATSSQATDLGLGPLAYRTNYVSNFSGITNNIIISTSTIAGSIDYATSSQTATFYIGKKLDILNSLATTTNAIIIGSNANGWTSVTSTSTEATALSLGSNAYNSTAFLASLATSTGTNFTTSGNTIQFPSFLAGAISTSTAATAFGTQNIAFHSASSSLYADLGFSNSIAYKGATTSQATELSLGANAYNSTAFLSSLATSTSGNGFTVSGNTIYFPTFLNPVVSTSTAYTAWGFANNIPYHLATSSQATDLGLGSNAYRSTTFLSSAITSLGGLTGTTQTFATTTGTNFTISSNGTTHTFQFPSFLAGVISTSTAYTSLGFSSPISYHSATGSQATDLGLGSNAYRSTTFLSSAITSLNGLTGAIQTFATSTGTNFTIDSNGTAHTFNFPSRIDQINSLATTTGNLIVGTSTGWSALGAGTPGRVLTSSSTAPFGLSWEVVSAPPGSGISTLNGLTETTQSFATSTGTNFTITSSGTTHTFQFPSFLAGITSTSTAYTAWSFSSPISYHSATSSQAVDLGLNDSAYREGLSSISFDSITAAIANSAVLDNNANTVNWNWDFTAAAVDSGLNISESSASTNGTQDQQALVKITTLSGSTASPLQVISNSTDVGDIFFNLVGSGDFEIRDAGTAFANFLDSGGITFTPTASADFVINEAAGTNMQLAASAVPTVDMLDISNIGQGVTASGISALEVNYIGGAAAIESSAIRVDLTPGGTTGGTWNAFRVAANSTGAVSGVTETGLNLEGPSSPGAGTELGITFATGWDYEINFEKATPTIRLAVTDNTGVLSIVDSNATPNTLLRLKDLSTNFGAYVESGGFINNNSYFGEEFNADTLDAAVTADSAIVGDNGTWYADTTGTTWTISQGIDRVNGTLRAVSTNTAINTILFGLGQAQNVLQKIFLKANLPVVQIKFQTSNIAGTTSDYVVGISDQATAVATNDTFPSNGIYFTNNNTGNWFGVVRSGGSNVGITSSCGAMTNTATVFRIEVIDTSTVRFLIDTNSGNGISFTDCGTVSGANPTAALGPTVYVVQTDTANDPTIDLDYFRAWQDDTGVPTDSVPLVAEQIVPTSLFNARVVLANLITALDNDHTTVEGGYADRLDIGRVIAGVEIVTPQITSRGLIIDTITALNDAITFQSDAIFFGRPYFNVDTAGFAIVNTDTRSVDVVFEKEYFEQPVVNATISFEGGTSNEESVFNNNIQYVITKKSTKGFTILLNRPAIGDIKFSWVALAVKGAKTFNSVSGEGFSQALPTPESPTDLSESVPTSSSTPSEEFPTENIATSTESVLGESSSANSIVPPAESVSTETAPSSEINSSSETQQSAPVETSITTDINPPTESAPPDSE